MTACQHIDCDVAGRGICTPWLWGLGGLGITDSHGGGMRTMGVRSLLRPQTHATARAPQAEHYVNRGTHAARWAPPPMRTRPHPRPCPNSTAKIKNRKFKPALTRPARSSTDRSVMAGPSADASALSTARSSGALEGAARGEALVTSGLERPSSGFNSRRARGSGQTCP